MIVNEVSIPVKNIIAAFSGKRVLVVGDFMLDEYIWGDVHRISPEAPVPVVNIQKRTYQAGGAGNVVANIAALQGIPLPGGVIGQDATSEQLLQVLATYGLPTNRGLIRSSQRHTTVKCRIVAHNQQVLRMDVENTDAITHVEETALLAWIADQMNQIDICVLSDYAKGVLTKVVCQETIRLCRSQGISVVVDPKGRNFSKYRGATVITPNTSEATLAADLHTGEELDHIGRTLQEQCPGSHILITRGSEGMSLFKFNGEIVHVPAKARHVFDVTGAGDTSVAALAMALACGAEPESAVQLANTAAGIVVGKFGTATVAQTELIDKLLGEDDG